MAPNTNFRTSSNTARPSTSSKGPELSSCSPENPTGPSILRLEAMVDELIAKVNELEAKVNELEGELYILRDHTILENPIDENQTTREPVHHRRYELRIIGSIKKRIYTGSKVHGQDGKLLKVAIYENGEKILSGPLAFAKFEVLVLEGNFSTNHQESWTSEKFQESLVKPRTEVGSILSHDYRSEFSNGEAVLDGIIFKDNSSWAVQKKWQLGIWVLGTFNLRVQEAISDPFRVLDRHGKATEKPDTPLLEDGVECLQRVGAKRALTLKENKINTVKDFLQLYHKNQTRLLKILGIKSELDESWKSMIKHAKKCDAGSDLYSYRKKNTVLFFNCVYEVVGAKFGNRYRPFDKLQDSMRTLVNKRKKGFYKSIKVKSFAADFKILNGQPVPVEYNFSGNSTDDDAPQHDQTVVLHNRQPADITLFPDDAEPDVQRDADQNITSDLNKTQQYYTPDGTVNQVQGQEGYFIQNSTLELNSTLVNEHLSDSVKEPCHDVSFWEEILEVPHAFQDMAMHNMVSSPLRQADTLDSMFVD